MSDERDPHFVLRFMDDETVEHELDLDEFQLALCPTGFTIRIGISGEQLKAIRNLSSLRDRVVEAWPNDNSAARLIAEKDAEIDELRHIASGLSADITHIGQQLEAAQDEIATLRERLDTPETENFIAGITLEAAHQQERWGSEHDAGKTALDWFWLIGYLAQKAVTADLIGDRDKAKHHTISTAGALLNWHRQLSGEVNGMRPGIIPPDHTGPEGEQG